MEDLPEVQPWMTRAEKMKIHRRRYAISVKGRVQSSKGQQRYMATDKGRARTKRTNERQKNDFPFKTKAFAAIRSRLRAHVKDRSKHIELAGHFESTFEPWMNWENYGQYTVAGPRKWCVGHLIPCSAYAQTETDMKRCFDLSNMRAQDARENALQRDAMPTQDVIERLKHLVPVSLE